MAFSYLVMEKNICGSLQHPNVADITDSGKMIPQTVRNKVSRVARARNCVLQSIGG
jgi:hypothetical protein